MNIKQFCICVVSVLLLEIKDGVAQDISFSGGSNKNPSKSTSKLNVKNKGGKIDVVVRAPSTCLNCDCQCDSYTWADERGNRYGNCLRPDNTNAKFCYVSGRALNACKDIQKSEYRKDSFHTGGRHKYYSYEACSTPPKQQCYQQQQYGNYQNCGDGDGGFNGGGYPNNNRPQYPNNPSYPNNNRPNYPNNNRPNYPNNNRPNYPNRPNRPSYPGFPNNNRPGYPNNNNNNNGWTLQQALGLGGGQIFSPRKDNKNIKSKLSDKKDTDKVSSTNDDSSVVFGA